MLGIDCPLAQRQRAPAFLKQARHARYILAARQELELWGAAAAAFPAAAAAIEQDRDVRLEAGVAQLLHLAERRLQARHELSIREEVFSVVEVHGDHCTGGPPDCG